MAIRAGCHGSSGGPGSAGIYLEVCGQRFGAELGKGATRGFGPVHNRRTDGRPCRCGTHHDDDTLGTPLNPDTYDYEAAVLWNAHAGAL